MNPLKQDKAEVIKTEELLSQIEGGSSLTSSYDEDTFKDLLDSDPTLFSSGTGQVYGTTQSK